MPLYVQIVQGRSPIATAVGQVDLDNINFISNDQLQTMLARTNANPAQVAEAVRVTPRRACVR